MILFITLFCCGILELISGQDCNGNYQILPSLTHRSTNNIVQYGPFESDDSLVNGWYNVGSNTMPNDFNNLLYGSCGCQFQVWMQGTVPTVNEGIVDRTVYTLGNFNEYENPRTISVRNCGTSMLYKLLPTTISARYCFDPIDPPIFRPDSATVKPGLRFNEMYNNGQLYKMPELQFRCDFRESMVDVLYYSVSWSVNEVFFKTKGPVLFSAIDNTNLYEAELIANNSKLDISIHCAVRSSVSINGQRSESTESARYWLGIRVVNPHIILPQEQKAKVFLQPTFPVGCSSPVVIPTPRPQCSMQISMFDPIDLYDCTSNSISVQGSQKCGVAIPAFYYDEWTPSASYDAVKEMTITSRNIPDYRAYKNRFNLKLVTEGTGLNPIVQKNYLADITVIAESVPLWQGKWCYSFVDPHMQTFDGKPYENQNLGIFIMYRHTSNNQEVQMKTKQCNWYATCACGVAVKAGGDIFLMDLCGNLRIIKHVSCKDGILDVRQETPYQYKIYMPFGTVVSVTINAWWDDSLLNIAIYPSLKDALQTSGLCGSLDNNAANDFTTPSNMSVSNNNDFSISWRIDQTQSFFVTANQNPLSWNINEYLCVCPAAITTSTTPGTASGSSLDALCSASVFQSCAKKANLPGSKYVCTIRTKRSKYSMSKEIERILIRREIHAEAQKHHNYLEKRSTFKLAFDEAYAQCASFFASNCSTSLFADSLPSSNLLTKNSSITNCAIDYTVIGDMSLANLHCETYRSNVEQEIQRNSTFREVYPDVVRSFRATACINNCNNNGDCVNGTCICYTPYIEHDCSLSLSDHPVVEDTYSGGLCQRDKGECCGQIPIYGSRFVKGITKQRVESFQIYINGSMGITEISVKDLSILNLFEAEMNVTCETRKKRSTNSDISSTHFVTGTRVSLTNDGTNFGSAKSYYVYDSRCQNVSNATASEYTFYLLDGTCFIDDTCYAEGDQDPLDICNRCRPSENVYSWTNECSSTTNYRATSTAFSRVSTSTTSNTHSNSNASVNDTLSYDTSTPMNNLTSTTARNNISKHDGTSDTNSSSTKIIIISLSVCAAVVVLVISVIIFIKCNMKKQKRISGQLERNVVTTMSGLNKSDNSMLFCSQRSLGENEGNVAEEEDDLHHDTLWKHRPGTPGTISMQIK